MGILFAALFLASTATHLYFSWKDHRRGRAWTKPFPIALLGLFYWFCMEAPSRYCWLPCLPAGWEMSC